MFPIISVPPDAAEAPEQMGTKRKFWFRDPDLGMCLFKLARPDTGEDWPTIDAFRHAGKLRPQAAEAWLARLGAVALAT